MVTFQKIMCVVIMATAANLSFAALAKFDAYVDRMITDDVNYAGCMAKIKPGPATQGLDCAPSFVTIDCSGELGSSKSLAAQKYSSAQLALVTGAKVKVVVVDTKKANGYCYLQRIDNYAP